MNDRFKFRATFSVSYYDENDNDKDIKLTIDDVAVFSGGKIGFSAQQMETIINALELPEIEQDTMWQFINDNYATSSYERFVCDNAIIEQCTGLKDKNGNLIYEGDIIRDKYMTEFVVKWVDSGFIMSDIDEAQPDDGLRQGWLSLCEFEIIGNIHEQGVEK